MVFANTGSVSRKEQLFVKCVTFRGSRSFIRTHSCILVQFVPGSQCRQPNLRQERLHFGQRNRLSSFLHHRRGSHGYGVPKRLGQGFAFGVLVRKARQHGVSRAYGRTNGDLQRGSIPTGSSVRRKGPILPHGNHDGINAFGA